jgi:hypothetical protein
MLLSNILRAPESTLIESSVSQSCSLGALATLSLAQSTTCTFDPESRSSAYNSDFGGAFVHPLTNAATASRRVYPQRFIFCLTSKMSHDGDWRDGCASSRRDKPRRWLWCLVSLFSFAVHRSINHGASDEVE